jgi:ElaB/YqjD/DUF883 family membrane-anchored ribosome-binding protein
MDKTPTSQASDVAGIKASFALDSSPPGLSGNTGTNLGEGHVALDPMGSESARRAVNRASMTAHEAVDRLAGRASRLAAKVDEKTQRLVQAPRQAWAYSKETVQAHPVQAVAASVAAGFVLGWLVSGGLSRHRSD